MGSIASHTESACSKSVLLLSPPMRALFCEPPAFPNGTLREQPAGFFVFVDLLPIGFGIKIIL